MPLTQITSGGIQDGTITNDDISASATIDATKITGLDKISEGNTEAEVVDTGSNGHFKVTTEGAERLRVDSSGRCGIGTSSPSARLDIAADSGDHMRFIGRGATDYSDIVFYSSANTTRLGYIDFANTQARINVEANVPFRLYTNAQERLTVTAAGNVGIGTASPASTLSVGGNAPLAGAIGAVCSAGGIALSLSDNVNSSLHVRTANGGAIIGTDAGGPLRFATSGVATTDERARLTQSGQWLVGTSSYSGNSKLVVNNAASGGSEIAVFRNEINPNYGGLVISGGITDRECRLQAAYGNSFLTFYTEPSVGSAVERFRISSTGAFGLAGANYGSSGQVLTSNGSGSAPSWSTPSGIGTGQTWQNVTGSRAFGTTYTNSTGKPIMVVIAFAYPGAGATGVLTVDGVAIQFGQVNAAYIQLASGTAIVPNGSTYAFNTTTTINNWLELR